YVGQVRQLLGDQLGDELLGLAAGGAVADGDDVELVLLHQLIHLVLGLVALADLRRGRRGGRRRRRQHLGDRGAGLGRLRGRRRLGERRRAQRGGLGDRRHGFRGRCL